MSSKEVNNGMSTTLMTNGQAVSTSPDWHGYRGAEASAITCNLEVYVLWFWGPMPPMPCYITKTQKGQGKGMQVCVRTTIPSQNT